MDKNAGFTRFSSLGNITANTVAKRANKKTISKSRTNLTTRNGNNHQTSSLLRQNSNLSTCTKKEFPFEAIVSMCGSVLDPEKYETRNDPMKLFGVVLNPNHFDKEAGLDTNEDGMLVEFVLAGEYG